MAGLGQSALLGLAEQMGQATHGAATALRRSVTRTPNPNGATIPSFEEPHECGELLVALIMQALPYGTRATGL